MRDRHLGGAVDADYVFCKPFGGRRECGARTGLRLFGEDSHTGKRGFDAKLAEGGALPVSACSPPPAGWRYARVQLSTDDFLDWGWASSLPQWLIDRASGY